MINTNPGFDEKHSSAIRIWHWLFFVFISCSILMVVLATYVFNTRRNIQLVNDELRQNGVIADSSVSRAVSHAFNDLCWMLHTWLGYGIASLVLIRLLLEFFQPSDQKLVSRIRQAMRMVPVSADNDSERIYYLCVKWVYVLFYALILIMALTGIGLAMEDVSFFRSARSTIKSVHAFIQYPIYGFILIHIAGVIRADVRRYPGLISGMFNGKPASRIKLK